MVDELRKQIEAVEKEIAELAQGELTIEAAAKILELREQLVGLRSDLDTHEKAEAALKEFEDEKAAAAKAEEDAAAAAAVAEAEAAAAAEAERVAAEAEADATVEPVPAEPAPVALAASAGEASPTAHETSAPAVTLTASANMGGVIASSVADRNDVQRMLNSALVAGGAGPVNGTLFRVNTHDANVDAVGGHRSAIENTRLMNAAYTAHQRPFSLTAAACFCGPDDVLRDIAATGSTERPIAALFGSTPLASTGSFRYVRNLALTDVEASGAVDIWTCADQAGVDDTDPLTWKQCATLNCFSENTVVPYFIKGCVVIEKPHQFAHPEQVDAFINQLYVDYARKAERELLDIIEADAGAPLTVGDVGGTMVGHGLLSQLLYGLGSIEHPIAYEFRDNGLEGHVLVVSLGLARALIADEHLRGFNHNKTLAELNNKLSADYGLRLVVRRDESTALTAGSVATVAALNAGGAIDQAGTPTVPAWRAYLLDPSQWRRGEGQFVGADYVSDADLVRQNRTMFFWENVEYLERTGVKKAHIIDLGGCINGARSDLVAPPAC